VLRGRSLRSIIVGGVCGTPDRWCCYRRIHAGKRRLDMDADMGLLLPTKCRHGSRAAPFCGILTHSMVMKHLIGSPVLLRKSCQRAVAAAQASD